MTILLERLISEDFGLDYSSKRWGRSSEHSSLVIDKDRELYFFNSRGLVGDALHYLINIRGMSLEKARLFLKENGYTDTYVITVNPGEKEDVITYPKLIDFFHELGQDHREYWYTRKFTDETIDRFQLGWYNDWYLIPIFMDGTFRQLQKRRDLPKKEITKWYRGTSPLLFNSDVLRLVDKVYIAEGPNDVIALMQQGLPAVCSDSGSGNWLPEWFFRFIRCKETIVVFDNDDAGEKGSRNIAKALGEYRTKIYNSWEFDKGYSPAYFFRDGGTASQFKDLISEKAKYIFELGKKENGKFRKTWKNLEKY